MDLIDLSILIDFRKLINRFKKHKKLNGLSILINLSILSILVELIDLFYTHYI